MDELPFDAGNHRPEHHSNVGYVLGTFRFNSYFWGSANPRHNLGRRSRRFLAVPSLRLFGFPGEMERKIETDGFSGTPLTFIERRNLTLAVIKGVIMFLQSLPTQDWGDHEIEMLLSEAFVLNSIWHNAQSHFNGK